MGRSRWDRQAEALMYVLVGAACALVWLPAAMWLLLIGAPGWSVLLPTMGFVGTWIAARATSQFEREGQR